MGKMAVNKTARTRRTLTHIPTPLPLDLSQNSSSSIVFYDQSQNGYSQASAASPDKQHNQVVQVAKPGDVVSKARYSSVSKARQDARVHIFTAALLEHICALYEPNPDKQRKVLQVLKYGFDSDDSLFILLTLAADLPKIYFVELCAKLTERDMLSPIAFLDIFSLWRTKYQIGFSELMKSTVKLVDMEPNQQALTPLLPAYSHAQLALLTKPVIGLLMRSPSDPRSSFFSSRYSNDFNEIKAIGSGGFGAVFKVKNKLDEVMYAIKKVRLKHLNHERCRKLLREVKVLATLNHPSIVRYNAAWLEQEAQPRITEVSTSPESSSSEDSISHNGATTADPFEDQRVMLYIQMELCHSNLHDWLFKRNKNLYLKHSDHETACGHIHESKNMHFTRQLLSGLDYIHTHGIIHRDIKTRNIFIGSHGALKIGDFGLARDVVASPSPTRAATSPSWDFSGKREMSDRLSKGIGTSVYSSPEQQNMRVYDSKTDMYSAGIIVFEMYCPFSTEMERYDRIKDLRRDRCIPATLLERWPDQMSMLNMMVDSNPDKRPSAKDLLSSDLYLDKDQVISHLETRVEELETRNDLLKREMLALKETLKIEANDYVEFQKWRESVKESTI